MIQTLNLFIGHSVHCRLKNRKTQPKDAQFFSWDIYISISLWISLHVSICKGSLSGNQTEAIPRNRLSNSFYWDSHIKNKYICKVWNGCKIPTNFNRKTWMEAHDNRSNLPVCGWQFPHNMCTVNVLRCTYYYYYYYHHHHHHHHCQKIHLVLRAPWIYWGGGGVVMAPLMKWKEENTYQPTPSQLPPDYGPGCALESVWKRQWSTFLLIIIINRRHRKE